MSKITDKAIKDYIHRVLKSYIKSNGMEMTKKISSGGLFSDSTWDNRIVYSFEDFNDLIAQGFSVDINMGIWLFNALNHDPEKK